MVILGACYSIRKLVYLCISQFGYVKGEEEGSFAER